VLQSGHLPLQIFVPFFVLDSLPFFIVTFFLHLTQYPSVIFASVYLFFIGIKGFKCIVLEGSGELCGEMELGEVYFLL